MGEIADDLRAAEMRGMSYGGYIAHLADQADDAAAAELGLTYDEYMSRLARAPQSADLAVHASAAARRARKNENARQAQLRKRRSHQRKKKRERSMAITAADLGIPVSEVAKSQHWWRSLSLNEWKAMEAKYAVPDFLRDSMKTTHEIWTNEGRPE